MTDKLIHMHKAVEEKPALDSKVAGGPSKTHGGITSGRIHAIAEDGSILVAIPSSGKRPCRADATVDVGPSDVGREVVLAYTPERGERPVILGVVGERSHPKSEARIDLKRSEVQDLHIDGQSIHFKASDEILLECGQGSIRLRKDGKIIIKGLQIVSRSKGVNKIKGAAVSIN